MNIWNCFKTCFNGIFDKKEILKVDTETQAYISKETFNSIVVNSQPYKYLYSEYNKTKNELDDSQNRLTQMSYVVEQAQNALERARIEITQANNERNEANIKIQALYSLFHEITSRSSSSSSSSGCKCIKNFCTTESFVNIKASSSYFSSYSGVYTDNELNSYIKVEVKIGSITPIKYKLGSNEMKSWILLGETKNGDWTVLDEQSDYTYSYYNEKGNKFKVASDEKFKSIKLIQRGKIIMEIIDCICVVLI
ncbi:hypothetical protein TVAG_311770 [Trichomonas vaginalis G3]|uniref:Uncharacterized protein n=1 Tax=Trichomonas vaginalis (strain ATCC PRA-98 / G3) TaxID=412133 RepID=A2EJY4_TRIV3|nr:hypothetical protein TVAGG3_0324820 [Trichomonas vaginalis G3]EAY07052.1 hypothetical protein TVAG_311770 [Trichomonas vaginalis G3]KAI5529552.1 hypothetical protein TVAGG3_0324820 [Trichomonas vaginalis G3]|eukprot:XP_001319275.1 hypothetical protein [Trichomonas vaginalis G3]